MAFEKDGVRQIETEELLEILKKKPQDITLVDVRENEEYNAGHIPGVKLIPTSEFVEKYEDELKKDETYIFICRSGNRSHMVCKFLQNQGFEDCTNYDGGMLKWEGPTETADLPPSHQQRW